jgi:hypothetical protein
MVAARTVPPRLARMADLLPAALLAALALVSSVARDGAAVVDARLVGLAAAAAALAARAPFIVTVVVAATAAAVARALP